jgi:hypothetical protein
MARARVEPSKSEIDEQSWRLARVYELLLGLVEEKGSAGRGEFGDLTQPAAADASPAEERHDASVPHDA